MYILLYNPLSNKGCGESKYLKVAKKLAKKKQDYKGYSLLDINGKEAEFLVSLNKEDIIVIIGGDGTLHQVVNRIKHLNLENRIFFCKGGSGNDFSRDHKGTMFEITRELKHLPKLIIDGKETTFINGAGMGIDAAVCQRVNEQGKLGIEESYFKTAIKIFKNFKQFSVDLIIDGQPRHFDKVWFISFQNGCYFGGGMKLAPHAKREDDHLDLFVIHSVKLWKLLLIFPLIFIGKHLVFKKVGIEEIFCKKATLTCHGFDILQCDGETVSGVKTVDIMME